MPRRYLPRRRLDESADPELASTGPGAPVLTDERVNARLTELLIAKGPESGNGNGGAVPQTSVARLQRLAGNRAVADRLGRSGQAIQRSRNRTSDEEEPIPEPAQAGPVEAAPEAEAGVAPPAQAGPVEAAPEAEGGVAPPAQAGPVEAAPEAEAGVAPPAQAGPVEAAPEAEGGVAPPAQAGPVEAAPEAEGGVAPPAQAGPVEAMAAPNAEEAAKAGIVESAKKPAGVEHGPTGLDKLVQDRISPIVGEGGRVLPGADVEPQAPLRGAPEGGRVAAWARTSNPRRVRVRPRVAASCLARTSNPRRVRVRPRVPLRRSACLAPPPGAAPAQPAPGPRCPQPRHRNRAALRSPSRPTRGRSPPQRHPRASRCRRATRRRSPS